MKTVIALGLVATVAAFPANGDPTPAACAVAEAAPRCDAVAQADGSVAYAVSGSTRFKVLRNGHTRLCVVIGGHEAGNLWVGQVKAGDVVRLAFLSGHGAAAEAGGSVGIGTVGFGSQDAC